jgi:hypothetical protein
VGGDATGWARPSPPRVLPRIVRAIWYRVGMAATLAEGSIEAVGSEPVRELGDTFSRRSLAGTEADKVRRQQHIRRKTRLARRALAANRTR